MRFVVAVPEGTTAALAAVVEEARAAEDAWWGTVREEVRGRWLAGAGRRDRAGLLREMDAARRLRERLREDGQLLGSRDRLVAHHARAVLASRGWDHDWPVVPPEAASAPGRRWGVSAADPPLVERISLDLPDPLGTRLRAAAHWSSADAVAALREWWETFGDGPIITDRLGGSTAALGRMLHALGGLLGDGPRRGDFDARAALRAQVTTTADILRDAITRTTTTAPPPAPPLPDPRHLAERHEGGL